MRPRSVAFFVLAGCLFASAAAAASAADKVSVKDLPEKYQKWLQEDVVYIISPKEKDVFLQLSNDRERDMFMEAFWKARDPDPSTPTNEVKDEHYRRIQYANLWFGRGLKAGGWRSDMGRIYITLGEPKTIERYENESNLYPMIVWFYDGMSEFGMPNAFNVVFFKKDGSGDYILYSPVRDGPMKLMPNYNGDMTDYQHAYRELAEINPPLADVSMTLIPDEYVMGMTPAISSDILLGQMIPRAGYNKVKDAYADKLLKYRDIIEVDYTANYISSDAMVQVFRDPAGRAFVHYLLEPSKLTLELYQGVYRTVLNVNGIVSDAAGKTVFQFDRSLNLDLNAEQFAKVKDRLVSFEDMFPMIDGDYKLSVLWKNTVSKEFTSVEASLKIPPAGSLTLSTPLLAHRVVRGTETSRQVKPFSAGGLQIVVSPRNDFTVQDTLSVYSEIGGLTQALRDAGSVAVVITKDDQEYKSVVKPLKDYPDPGRILEEFPLAGYPPAYYAVRVSVLDAAKTEIVSSRAMFYVSLSATLPRAWILYPPQLPADDPSYGAAIGLQYLRINNLPKAREFLERAHRQAPESPELALDFCKVLYVLKDYEGLKAVAIPFYKAQKLEFAQYLGESAQALGQYAEAIAYYKDYLASFGTNINVLNSIGECYLKVGDVRQALVAWRKSLELNPKQDALKAKVAELENKK